MLDPTCSPKVTEDIRTVLGYPEIEVNPSKRPIQCPNCGRDGHTEKQCPVPTMEKLFELFGARLFDNTPTAIEEKRKIILEYMEK
ncbi:retrovirus zinc finger-like domains family [Trichomonas vaginalis G3]|uniref:retrovirus zinc finger-like domains family n=1 Tax=Trichomonas vaginalis (strain ATCC PRA-98 / G3) TaxID=412133 RepID=UPI0021E569C4|nr:retrovirus zinc finger-like domains family [Trichomonas vaginalis G3]KAI5519548.1 retrovirus zinc finger-like domains family [Trichomonas vaginalis G3]